MSQGTRGNPRAQSRGTTTHLLSHRDEIHPNAFNSPSVAALGPLDASTESAPEERLLGGGTLDMAAP